MDGPDLTARRAADAMWADDTASRALGMELVEVGPGRAGMTMLVRDDMVNGLGVCHGGIIFALADSAMAFASNSRNVQAFASTATISWLRPARRGDLLTAGAIETGSVGRSGVWDVEVTNQDSELVALFRGLTRSVGRPVTSAE